MESFKIHSGLYSGSVGIPDLIFLWSGKSLYLEAKAKYGVISPNQLATHIKMRKVGASTWFVYPDKYPNFIFKAQVKGGKFVEFKMDITLPEVWWQLFQGPD